jgi:hypothetical protein
MPNIPRVGGRASFSGPFTRGKHELDNMMTLTTIATMQALQMPLGPEHTMLEFLFLLCRKRGPTTVIMTWSC